MQEQLAPPTGSIFRWATTRRSDRSSVAFGSRSRPSSASTLPVKTSVRPCSKRTRRGRPEALLPSCERPLITRADARSCARSPNLVTAAAEVEAECGELPSRSCSRQRLRLGPQQRRGGRALPPSCPDLQHRSPTMQLLQPAFNHGVTLQFHPSGPPQEGGARHRSDRASAPAATRRRSPSPASCR